jgi:hypothetical protein
VEENVILPEPFTSKTPHHNPRQGYETEAKEIIERRKNCRGPVICIVPQKEGERNSPRNVSFVTPGLIGGALVASITSA